VCSGRLGHPASPGGAAALAKTQKGTRGDWTSDAFPEAPYCNVLAI
jgi:hypothetical protein